MQKSQQISKEISAISNKLESFDKAKNVIEGASELIELAELEEDESILEEVEIELSKVEEVLLSLLDEDSTTDELSIVDVSLLSEKSEI